MMVIRILSLVLCMNAACFLPASAFDWKKIKQYAMPALAVAVAGTAYLLIKKYNGSFSSDGLKPAPLPSLPTISPTTVAQSLSLTQMLEAAADKGMESFLKLRTELDAMAQKQTYVGLL